MERDIDRIIYTEGEIQRRVKELGVEVDEYLERNVSKEEIWSRPPIAVCILRGASVFMADLTRYMEVPIEYDFMSVSTYGDATEPGEVRVLKDLDRSITNRIVIVVEDIVDTGETLHHLLRAFHARSPKAIKVSSLLDKSSRRKKDVDIDFKGFDLEEDLFLVGYGMDYAGKYRNLPFIGTLKEELIDE
ncbi:hypoxanthine phosphoribosyltransferase [Candidatus Bipolaricaulota bacterium]|nr:hypoxanthine phosphoribosyltransferase [Candidatus Bipolaricaulota bacterium]